MFGAKNTAALVAIGALGLLVGVVYLGLTAIPRVANVAANQNSAPAVTKVATSPNPTAEAITAAAPQLPQPNRPGLSRQLKTVQKVRKRS